MKTAEERAKRDAAILVDRKAGMSWKALKKKHNCAQSVIAKALKSTKASASPKKSKDKLAAVNKALVHAAKAPAAVWYVALGKSKGLCPHKTKADALQACLHAQLKGTKVRLLREVPFRLTVVIDE